MVIDSVHPLELESVVKACGAWDGSFWGKVRVTLLVCFC